MNPKLLAILVLTAAISVSIFAQEAVLPTSDGNRFLSGSIELNYALEISVPLPSIPVRIVGDGNGTESTWFVLLDNGHVLRIVVGEFGETAIADLGRQAGSDELLGIIQRGYEFSPIPSGVFRNNPRSLPLILDDDTAVSLDSAGGLVIGNLYSNTVRHIDGGFLFDSRILRIKPDRLLVLASPSDRYPHGILGDRIEATAYRIVDPRPDGGIVGGVDLETGVFETLSPVVEDTDGDGADEIVITRSEPGAGARIEVYGADELEAAGKSVGLSYRWIHILAVAATGPSGETEIIAVRTPHIGGVLEYYRHIGSTLEVVHTRNGVSTHRIGSRNLDTAIAGDLNGDGDIEILVPSDDFRRLLSIKRTDEGSEIDATQYLGAELSTNVAGFSFDDRIELGIGTEAGDFIIIRDF